MTWALLLKDKSDINITKGYINTHITRLANRPVKYIAVHYTAGSTSKPGAALSTRNVFLQPKRKASADFVVDDATIVQINPDLNNYFCWSVGDSKNGLTGGGRLYGIAGNRNTISIEICSNLKKGYDPKYANHDGWYYTDASLDNAIKLIRYLMKVYNLPKTSVVRHYDISGKICPGIIGWNDAYIYSNTGKQSKEKNNSKKWMEFWNKI
jgi:N-acetylmuramoyl-L-alanine amidase CwlA